MSMADRSMAVDPMKLEFERFLREFVNQRTPWSAMQRSFNGNVWVIVPDAPLVISIMNDKLISGIFVRPRPLRGRPEYDQALALLEQITPGVREELGLNERPVTVPKDGTLFELVRRQTFDRSDRLTWDSVVELNIRWLAQFQISICLHLRQHNFRRD